MKKMWARVGISIMFEDKEYKEFIEKAIGTKEEKLLAQEILEKKLNIKSKKVVLSGESYFPEQGCFGDDSTDNIEELDFLF